MLVQEANSISFLATKPEDLHTGFSEMGTIFMESCRFLGHYERAHANVFNYDSARINTGYVSMPKHAPQCLSLLTLETVEGL